MKILDIGDVMNKFEVLGIVGEGESAQHVFSYSRRTTALESHVASVLLVLVQFACGTRSFKASCAVWKLVDIILL